MMTEILMIILLAVTAILWIWAFVDISKSRFEKNKLKFLWIAGILIFPILGSIIYFQFSKKFKKRKRKFEPNFNKTVQA